MDLPEDYTGTDPLTGTDSLYRLTPMYEDIDIEKLHLEDAGPDIKIGIWVLVSLSALFLAIRVYCKRVTHAKLYWDDWVLINAWLALLANAIFTHVAIDAGYGKHSHMVPPENLSYLVVTGLLSVTFSIIGQAWSKTSFAMTLLRFTQGRIRAFILVNIVLINTLFGLSALFFWVQCTPVEKTWTIFMEGSCWDPKVNVIFGIIVGGYSGIMDLVLSALPWKVLKNLNMRPQEKIGVALAMNMGVFAGVAAFIKCSYMPTLMYGDFSYNGAQLVIWAAAETAVTIIATSIPVMRPLMRDFVSRKRKSSPRHEDEESGEGPTLSRSISASSLEKPVT